MLPRTPRSRSESIVHIFRRLRVNEVTEENGLRAPAVIEYGHQDVLPLEEQVGQRCWVPVPSSRDMLSERVHEYAHCVHVERMSPFQHEIEAERFLCDLDAPRKSSTEVVQFLSCQRTAAESLRVEVPQIIDAQQFLELRTDAGLKKRLACRQTSRKDTRGSTRTRK